MKKKNEIQKIKERNKKVEVDKAWEVSNSRRGLIALATYIVIVLWQLIKNSNPWINALIPAGAFYLSTLTFPFAKKWWIRNIYRR
jgi:hypothetical protein